MAVWGAVRNAALGVYSSLENMSREIIALLTKGSGHGTSTADREDVTYHPKLKNAVIEEPSQYMEVLGFTALLG